MEKLDCFILENQQFYLARVLGKLPVHDLKIYEDMGNNAFNNGNPSEALNWFTKGLSMSRELNNKPKIELFTHLILSSL